MELITYSVNNKNIFWIHLRFHISKLRLDLDKIYTNIGKLNFYPTNRCFQLFFFYIEPSNSLERITYFLNDILRADYHYTEDTIQYTDDSESIQINYGFFNNEYNYTKLTSTTKYKSITLNDIIFIKETFDNFKQILNFITNEIVSKELDNSHCTEEKIKLKKQINKLVNKINRLENYLTEIPTRI